MPTIGFPFLFLAVFISLQLNLSPWQPAKPYLRDATWLYPSGNKTVCCLHSCSWRKPSLGMIWEFYPWHIDCGLLIDMVYLAHSHLNWDIESLSYSFTTYCSVSSRICEQREAIYWREGAHKEEKDKYLIKDFMIWKNIFIISALERDVKVTEDLS